MKICVLSDTHMARKAAGLPVILSETMKTADYIFHAGDIGDISLITALEAYAPVTAVAGNTDTEDMKRALGLKKIVSLEGMNFGLFHGHGEKGKTINRVLDCFRQDALDCIVFGHSHNPYIGYHNGTLLFNPGSPTDKRRNEYFSFGILDVGQRIVPRHVYFHKEGP